MPRRLPQCKESTVCGKSCISLQKVCRIKAGEAPNKNLRTLGNLLEGSKPETPEETSKRLLKQAQENYEEYKERYIKKMGRVENGELTHITLNTDDWRDLFPEYTGTNAALVHSASSYLNKRLLEESLQTMRGKGNNTVLVLAGGGGSGKGTATKDKYALNEYPIVLDQVSDDYDSLMGKMEKASKAGFKNSYAFIDRHVEDAIDGIVTRAIESREAGNLARTVPMSVAVSGNIKARQVALEMIRRHPEFSRVINNNLGFGKAEFVDNPEEYLQQMIARNGTVDNATKKAESVVKNRKWATRDQDILQSILQLFVLAFFTYFTSIFS